VVTANVNAWVMLSDKPLAYKHTYNDYIYGWTREMWDHAAAGPMPPGTGDLDMVDPQYKNVAGGDLRLNDTSPLATAGESGTTIGAYQITTAINEWMMY
jgi:hypothetical protein